MNPSLSREATRYSCSGWASQEERSARWYTTSIGRPSHRAVDVPGTGRAGAVTRPRRRERGTAQHGVSYRGKARPGTGESLKKWWRGARKEKTGRRNKQPAVPI